MEHYTVFEQELEEIKRLTGIERINSEQMSCSCGSNSAHHYFWGNKMHAYRVLSHKQPDYIAEDCEYNM